MPRLLPDFDIRTDEDLTKALEGIRQVGIAGHDELDELAGLVRAKIERYARRNGIGRVRARFWGRTVALPLTRCAEAMLTVAGYAKTCSHRFEAFIVALDEDDEGATDFDIKARRRPRKAA